MNCVYCKEESYIIFEKCGNNIKFKCGTIINNFGEVKQSRYCKAKINKKSKCYTVKKRKFLILSRSALKKQTEDLAPQETISIMLDQLEDFEKEKIF